MPDPDKLKPPNYIYEDSDDGSDAPTWIRSDSEEDTETQDECQGLSPLMTRACSVKDHF